MISIWIAVISWVSVIRWNFWKIESALLCFWCYSNEGKFIIFDGIIDYVHSKMPLHILLLCHFSHDQPSLLKPGRQEKQLVLSSSHSRLILLCQNLTIFLKLNSSLWNWVIKLNTSKNTPKLEYALITFQATDTHNVSVYCHVCTRIPNGSQNTYKKYWVWITMRYVLIQKDRFDLLSWADFCVYLMCSDRTSQVYTLWDITIEWLLHWPSIGANHPKSKLILHDPQKPFWCFP